MKLTLQLVVVVLSAQTMFHDNMLNFTSIQYNTQGRRHEMAGISASSFEIYFNKAKYSI